MPDLHIPYTLSFMANIGRDKTLGTHIRGFMAEFDCTLDVEYADTDNWEITSVTFEQTRFDNEFTVSAKTDPEMWKLLDRSFEYDWKDLSDKVRECIIEDHAEYGDDRGDYLRDMQMSR